VTIPRGFVSFGFSALPGSSLAPAVPGGGPRGPWRRRPSSCAARARRSAATTYSSITVYWRVPGGTSGLARHAVTPPSCAPPPPCARASRGTGGGTAPPTRGPAPTPAPRASIADVRAGVSASGIAAGAVVPAGVAGPTQAPAALCPGLVSAFSGAGTTALLPPRAKAVLSLADSSSVVPSVLLTPAPTSPFPFPLKGRPALPQSLKPAVRQGEEKRAPAAAPPQYLPHHHPLSPLRAFPPSISPPGIPAGAS